MSPISISLGPDLCSLRFGLFELRSGLDALAGSLPFFLRFRADRIAQSGLDIFSALLLETQSPFEFHDTFITFFQLVAASGIRRIKGLSRANCFVAFRLEPNTLGLHDA
jgi:hypothetical protein